MKQFTRITVNPDQMGGVPCIRGIRIPVATVVGMLAEGVSKSEILAAYPDLELGDIREAVRFESGLRRRVRLGIRAVHDGDYTIYDAEAGLRKLADEIKSRGRSRLAATKRPRRSKRDHSD